MCQHSFLSTDLKESTWATDTDPLMHEEQVSDWCVMAATLVFPLTVIRNAL